MKYANWRCGRRRDEITLHYNHGRCQIDPLITVKPNATLKDVWRKSIEQPGLLVQLKHQKNHVLELDVYIDFPLLANDQNERQDSDLDSVGHCSIIKICS